MNIRLRIQAAHWFAASVGWLFSAPGSLRIFTFHDVSDDVGDLFAVTRRHLSDYLSLLSDNGYVTIRARDLLAGWPSVIRQERVVLLTFDDGYVAHRDIVAGMLERHGMTATFFVISSLLHLERTRGRFTGRDYTFLSSEDLREMDRAGFEIGSHSHSHALLGQLEESQVAQEVVLSKQILERELGHEITSFAYPYGRRRAFSEVTRQALLKAGYGAAFTQEGVRITRDCDLLRCPRTSIDSLDDRTTFRRKLQGYYDVMGEVRRVDPRRSHPLIAPCAPNQGFPEHD